MFKARVNTNKTPAEWGAGVDFICSRILWLDGLEYGHNSDGVRGAASGKQCDSYRRYIYIHGTGNERTMIYPASYGCVRMSNNDVCEVFEMLSVDSLVYIAEDLPKTHRRFNISQVNDNIEHTTGTMK